MLPSAYVLFRLVKWVGIACFTGGLFLGVAGRPEARLRGVLRLGTTGLLISWTSGFGVLRALELRLEEGWMHVSLLASLLALAGAILAASTRFRKLGSAMSAACMTLTLGFMTLRSFDLVSVGLAFGLATVAGGLAAWRTTAGDPPDNRIMRDSVWRWFVWVARLEGLSLIALFFVYMPFKYALFIELDGGQGWFGWVHGELTILYAMALVASMILLRLRWYVLPLGVLASVLPGGTFALEWWLGRGLEKEAR